MNYKAPPVKNQRKVIWVIAIVAVAAVYQLAHPFLEKTFKTELPSLVQEDNVAARDKSNREWNESDWKIPEGKSNQSINGETDSKSGRNNAKIGSNKGNSFLVPTGKKNRLRSPAGLEYGESRGEHRVDHVMRHARDMPGRPVHSVFDGNRDEILRMIDEAYELIKSNSKRVQKIPDKRLDFRTQFKVDMKRKIGYLGGKRGKRENHPSRSKLTLVLDNEKFVVTAYPDR